MENKLRIDFEGFTKEWQEIMSELFENLELKVDWKHSEDRMEITGNDRKLQNVKKMLELSDNGLIVENWD